MTHATTPHLETADSGLLQDTILHHDELIARLMDTAATRYDELAPSVADPPSPAALLSSAQLDDLGERFIFVLEVACELGSRTSP
jgi:hypothetical protein